MQQIERYGVMVLLFMLVTILVVSLWDGEEQPEQPSRTPSVALASPSVAAPARGGDRSSRPVAVPARERETQRAPLTAASSRTDQQRRRGARQDPGHVLPTPDVRTVGPPMAPGTAGAGAASPEPSTGSVPAARSRTPETARMAGSTDVPGGQVASRSATAQPQGARAAASPAGTTRAWTYEIKSGDTLQGIAARVLGDGKRWREIQDANPGLDPRRLMVGKRISLPRAGTTPGTTPGTTSGAPPVSSSVTPARTAAATPRAGSGSYVIQKGDVLSRIAQTQLGSARRWREIVELNPGLDPDRLFVGQSLRLPGAGGQPAAPATPRRSSGEAVAQASTSEPRYRVR